MKDQTWVPEGYHSLWEGSLPSQPLSSNPAELPSLSLIEPTIHLHDRLLPLQRRLSRFTRFLPMRLIKRTSLLLALLLLIAGFAYWRFGGSYRSMQHTASVAAPQLLGEVYTPTRSNLTQLKEAYQGMATLRLRQTHSLWTGYEWLGDFIHTDCQSHCSSSRLTIDEKHLQTNLITSFDLSKTLSHAKEWADAEGFSLDFRQIEDFQSQEAPLNQYLITLHLAKTVAPSAPLQSTTETDSSKNITTKNTPSRDTIPSSNTGNTAKSNPVISGGKP